MKQHITVEQLQELTDKQKKRLWEQWKPQYGDIFFTPGNCFVCGWDYKKNETHLPLLSIGRMIELLESEYQTVYTSKHIPDGMFKTTVYSVSFTKDGCGFWGETLCDALWETVKAIL